MNRPAVFKRNKAEGRRAQLLHVMSVMDDGGRDRPVNASRRYTIGAENARPRNPV